MKTFLGIGVVAELLGVCLAFAPTAVFPTPRSYSSSFTPQLTRCYIKLASTVGNVHRASCSTCSHVGDDGENDDDSIDETGKESKWNEITSELRLAGKIFCRVTGVDPTEIQTLFDTLEELDTLLETTYIRPDFFQECIDNLLPWKSIKRGKDLFISKMGTFDINEAYRGIMAEKQNELDDRFVCIADSSYADKHWTRMEGELGIAMQRQLVLESRWFDWRRCFDNKEEKLRFRLGAVQYRGYHIDGSLPYWLVSPLELQCVGYFEEGYNSGGYSDWAEDHDGYLGYTWNGRLSSSSKERLLLSQSEEYPQRQYLTKYYQGYFKLSRWHGYLDELIRCGSRYPEDRQYMAAPQPDRIQNIYQIAWPLDQGANEVGPPPQLFERIYRLRREWIQKKNLGENEVYEHLHALKGLEINGIKLVVLRSKYDIYEVGKELRNCAFDYAPFVASKVGVLIKTEREDGRTVALGLFNLRRNDYDQIYGLRNEPVDEIIRDTYQSYMPIIREWADKSNV